MIFTILSAVIVTILLFVTLIRNRIVCKFRIKALEITSTKAKESIDEGRSDWLEYYNHYHSFGSYNKMVLDLRKWKFDDFYPGI